MKIEQDILKTAVYFARDSPRYGAMRQMRLHYPVSLLSRILRVSASGFYAWRDRLLSKRAHEEARLEVVIKVAHRQTRQTNGAERLQHELAEDRIRAGIFGIERIKKEVRAAL